MASRDTTVRVGTYLRCRMRQVEKIDETTRCSANEHHRVYGTDKFCSTCGAKVTSAPTTEMTYNSMGGVYNENIILPKADGKWLFDRFTPVFLQTDAGVEDDVEIVMYDPGSHTIDANDDVVKELNTMSFKIPTADEIEKLQSLIGYTEVTVHFGVVIENVY